MKKTIFPIVCVSAKSRFLKNTSILDLHLMIFVWSYKSKQSHSSFVSLIKMSEKWVGKRDQRPIFVA